MVCLAEKKYWTSMIGRCAGRGGCHQSKDRVFCHNKHHAAQREALAQG